MYCKIKQLCIKLVVTKHFTKMHGTQNVKGIVKVLGVILVSAGRGGGGTTGSYSTVINSLDENPLVMVLSAQLLNSFTAVSYKIRSYRRIHNSPTLIPTLSHTNPAQTMPP